MYTSIHRALGLAPSELTYELLEACVAARVPESASLDWKQKLPFDESEGRWQDEWAKDVAAMANSGGGCIVYGVAEESTDDDGARVAMRMVDVGPFDRDDVEKRLRPHDLYREIPGHPVATTVYDLDTVPGLRRLTFGGGDGDGAQTDSHFDGSVPVVEHLRDPMMDQVFLIAMLGPEATAREARSAFPHAPVVEDRPRRRLRRASSSWRSERRTDPSRDGGAGPDGPGTITG